jgi:hypothetical protein
MDETRQRDLFVNEVFCENSFILKLFSFLETIIEPKILYFLRLPLKILY